MALGKLWNALFGKRSETESIATAVVAEQSAAVASTKAAAAEPEIAKQAVSVSPPIQKSKGKAVAGKARKSAQAPSLTIAAVDETPEVVVKRIPHPKRNAWSKLIAGRQITSILDTNLGDASGAVELLQAIVCDAMPTPKYIAIDDFDLTSGGTTVLQFHQRVRRVGGKAVPIPGAIDDGLRQLSCTIGAVDLVLIDDAKTHWQSDETRRLLARVTHVGTLLLRRDTKNNWTVVERNTIAQCPIAQTDQSKSKLTRAA